MRGKRILSVILLLAIAVSLFSCSDESKFGHAELVISLTDDYYRTESEKGYDKVYTNGERIIAITRLSFDADGISEFMSPYEFGEFWLGKFERNTEIETSPSGVAYATYYDGYGDSEVFYLEAFIRAPYAYFVILGAAPVADRDGAMSYFLDVINNVYIKNEG